LKKKNKGHPSLRIIHTPATKVSVLIQKEISSSSRDTILVNNVRVLVILTQDAKHSYTLKVINICILVLVSFMMLIILRETTTMAGLAMIAKSFQLNLIIFTIKEPAIRKLQT